MSESEDEARCERMANYFRGSLNSEAVSVAKSVLRQQFSEVRAQAREAAEEMGKFYTAQAEERAEAAEKERDEARAALNATEGERLKSYLDGYHGASTQINQVLGTNEAFEKIDREFWECGVGAWHRFVVAKVEHLKQSLEAAEARLREMQKELTEARDRIESLEDSAAGMDD